jgi:CMP/dCMP kinase
MRINVAIDGPGAAGKSTIAKRLAKRFNYRYLDTGAMYRCVALKAINHQLALDDETGIMQMLSDTSINFDDNLKVYLDHEDVTECIRAHNISLCASTISMLPLVRADMVKRQQAIAHQYPGIVMDGRDIGSVVLPDAQLKIYLVADSVVRAKRRVEELKARGQDCEFDEVLKDIEFRDQQDMHRQHSPLIKCEDAIEVDTSEMSIDEVVNVIATLIAEREQKK